MTKPPSFRDYPIGWLMVIATLLVVVAVLFGATAWLFMVCWNYGIVPAIGVNAITFWQSAAIWGALVLLRGMWSTLKRKGLKP